MISEKKIKKWEALGLLQEVPEEEKPQLAQLLENQAIVMLKKGEFWLLSKIAIPVVRRVWNKLEAEQKEHVMDLPACLIEDTAYIAENHRFSAGMDLEKEFGGHGICGGYFALDREAEICQKLADGLGEHLSKQGAIALYFVLEDAQISAENDTDTIIVSRYARLAKEKRK